MARNEELIPYGLARSYKRADGAIWVYSHKDSSIALHGTTSSVHPRKSLFRMAEKYLGPEWCPDLSESRLSWSKRRLEDWLNGDSLDLGYCCLTAGLCWLRCFISGLVPSVI